MSAQMSLKGRLIKSTLVLSLMVALLGAVAIGLVVNHSNNEVYDELIESNARALIGDGNASPEIADEFRRLNDELDIEYQVFNAQGILLSKTYGAPDRPYQHSFDNDSYYNVRQAGEWWRLYTLYDGNLNRYVQIAQPWQQRLEHTVLSVVNYLVLMAVFLLALMAAQLWAIGSGLKPLKHLSESLAKKDLQELSAIQPDVPMREIAPLIDAINQLFMRLNASKVAQERFIADAAHELRTPLAAIAMQLQLLARRYQSDGALTAELNTLRRDVMRATNMVESLLMLARLDQQDTLLQVGVVPVAAWVEDVLSDMRQHPEWASAEVTVDLLVGEAAILGNAALMHVALRNLVDNALRYGKSEDGKAYITIKAWQTHGCVHVSVQDAGIGVGLEDRMRLEERFFRVLGTQQTGSGLGLSIVRKIIEHHQATLKFTQGLQGRGFGVEMKFQAYVA